MQKIKSLFFPHDKKNDHFKALDGLRGIAVIFVLLSHSSKQKIFFFNYFDFHEIGKAGVYLFFILSAYLLDRQIAIALKSGTADRNFWGSYFLKRVLRIYPLFLTALIIHYIVYTLGYDVKITSPKDIPLHLLLLKGESIFWSIPVEFKYYLVSPFLMIICNRFLKWKWNHILIIFSALIFVSIGFQSAFDLSNLSTFRYFPIFLIGSLLAVYEILFADRIYSVPNKKMIEAAGFISCAFVILSIPSVFDNLIGFKVFKKAFGLKVDNFNDPIFYLPFSICWGLILFASKNGYGLLKKFFQLQFFRFIGVISFSVYLFHIPVLMIVSKTSFIPQYLKAPVFLVATLIFSSITYLLIEKPLAIFAHRRSKKSFSKKISTAYADKSSVEPLASPTKSEV